MKCILWKMDLVMKCKQVDFGGVFQYLPFSGLCIVVQPQHSSGQEDAIRGRLSSPLSFLCSFNGFATTFRNLRGHHQSGLMIFEDLERLLERVEACYVFYAFMVVMMVVEYLIFN